MPTSLPKKFRGGFRRQTEPVSSQRGLLEASVFVAVAFCALTMILPASFVLPALSLVIVLSGLVLGASALAMNHFQGLRHARLMEIAGVLVLFGFAAAIVCDNADAVHLFTGRASI